MLFCAALFISSSARIRRERKVTIGKLKAYGISGGALNWIIDYLSERTVDGTESEVGAVLSGVPQGTVLGRLLFVIYINDMLDSVSSISLLFADDRTLPRSTKRHQQAGCMDEDLVAAIQCG